MKNNKKTDKTLRGGSIGNDSFFLRSAKRNPGSPFISTGYSNYGFRIVIKVKRK